MSEATFVVELRALPLDVHRHAEEQSPTMRRELALVHVADELGSAPERLLWLSDQLSQRYAAFGSQPQTVLRSALAGDSSHIDLRYEVPAHAAEAAEELAAVLEEVDEFCRAGDLLTLVAPPDAQAYRRWFLSEFVAQIRLGAPPTPWAGVHEEDRVSVRDADAPGPFSAPATVVVDDDLYLEGAARVRHALVGILDGGVSHLTIDLTGCRFIDSVGISLLLTTRDRLQDSGGTVVIANAHGQPRRTVETTGIYDVLVDGV